MTIVHHTSEFKQYCHVGNTAQQCRQGLFQDSDFAGNLEDSKINIRRNVVHIRKSHVCSNKLGVQETNICFTQFNGIWNYFSWCQVCASTVFPLLSFGIWLLKCVILHQTNQRKPKIKNEETRRLTPHQASTPTFEPKIQFLLQEEVQTSTPKTKPRFQFITTILNCVMLIMFRRTRSLLILVQCSTFLRTTKQWLKWSSKAEVQQWDTYPEPTELLVTGCLTELIWIRRFKSSTSTPNINSQTYWQRELHTWWMEQSSSSVEHQSFQHNLLLSEFQLDQLHGNDGEKDARTERRREDCGKVKADVQPGLTCLNKFFDCAESSCVEKPRMLKTPCQNDW